MMNSVFKHLKLCFPPIRTPQYLSEKTVRTDQQVSCPIAMRSVLRQEPRPVHFLGFAELRWCLASGDTFNPYVLLGTQATHRVGACRGQTSQRASEAQVTSSRHGRALSKGYLALILISEELYNPFTIRSFASPTAITQHVEMDMQGGNQFQVGFICKQGCNHKDQTLVWSCTWEIMFQFSQA